MSNTLTNSKNQNFITASEKKISETEFVSQDHSYEEQLHHPTKLIKSKKILLDTRVTITVELGKSKIKIKDFLRLSQGDVFFLNKSVQEPLDIFINNCLIASGEIVVSDQKYGIRITNIKSSLKNVDILSKN